MWHLFLSFRSFSKIYQLKCLKPKNKGHANFYECSDLTEKVYLESLLLDQRLKINNYWQKWSCSSIKKSFIHVDIFSLGYRRKKKNASSKKLFQLTVPLFLDLVLCSILKRLELPGVIFRLHFASREVQRDRFTIHSGRPHSRKSVGTGRKIRKKCNFFERLSLLFV